MELRILGIQEFRNWGIQESRKSGSLELGSAGIRELRNSAIQQFSNSRIQEFRDSGFPDVRFIPPSQSQLGTAFLSPKRVRDATSLSGKEVSSHVCSGVWPSEDLGNP